MSFSPPGTITGSGTANTLAKFIAGTVVGNALITDDATTVTVNTTSAFLSAATSTGSAGFLSVTGTLPSITTGAVSGVKTQITSAGNTANPQFATSLALLAGYTGASATAAVYSFNSARSTQSVFSAGGGALGNSALFGDANGSTSVDRVGVFGRATVGVGSGYGVIGRGNDSAGAALGIGGLFLGFSNTVAIGVYAALKSNDGVVPTFTTAAVLVDNGAVAAPIAIFRDNGTAKVTINDGGSVTFAAGCRLPIVTTAIAYAATTNDYTILADVSAAGFTVTLPTAASCAGLEINVKKIDATANLVTVSGNGSNIDATPTQTISAQYQSLYFQSDGVKWWII